MNRVRLDTVSGARLFQPQQIENPKAFTLIPPCFLLRALLRLRQARFRRFRQSTDTVLLCTHEPQPATDQPDTAGHQPCDGEGCFNFHQRPRHECVQPILYAAVALTFRDGFRCTNPPLAIHPRFVPTTA